MKVSRTDAGLFVRNDGQFGLVVFSPYTGLFHAAHPSIKAGAQRWLAGGEVSEAVAELRRTVGIGWAAPWSDAVYDRRLLPASMKWEVSRAAGPLLINWLITGNCPLACLYCYAEDLMRNPGTEPTASTIKKTALAIRRLKPLAVVVTGGDPLSSPHLRLAVELLAGRCGVVLDTSGYAFSQRHLELVKEFSVSVRVSMDGERPQVHNGQRPTFVRSGPPQDTHRRALDAINMCLEAGVPVTVQTVATYQSIHDLESLGDKLLALGVHSWRVFRVAPSSASMAGFRQVAGPSGKLASGAFAYVFRRLMLRQRDVWKSKLAVQITSDEPPNSVILVSPDGRFMTESAQFQGKLLLDPESPTAPTVESIEARLNFYAHTARYLNLTTDHFSDRQR